MRSILFDTLVDLRRNYRAVREDLIFVPMDLKREEKS